jgi:hypothetical protein
MDDPEVKWDDTFGQDEPKNSEYSSEEDDEPKYEQQLLGSSLFMVANSDLDQQVNWNDEKNEKGMKIMLKF